MSSYLGYLS